MAKTVLLEEAFEFTQEEVALNSKGILSERQKESLQKSLRYTKFLALLAIFVLLISTIALSYGLITALGTVGAISVIVLLMVIGLSARRGVSVFRGYFRYQKNWRVAQISVLRNVHPTDFKAIYVGRHKFYVHDAGLELNEKEFSVLEESLSYHIYYLSYENRPIHLLSVKAIS